jgi:DNA-binding response OmpR family regulator
LALGIFWKDPGRYLGANMLRILLAGSDSRLLSTRAAVLSKTGAAVVYGNPMEVLEILDGHETFDLVVLCHTLEDSDVVAIVDKAHRKIAGVKILMVTSELEGHRMLVNSKVDATTMPEPAHLVALAKEMLQVGAYASSASV